MAGAATVSAMVLTLPFPGIAGFSVSGLAGAAVGDLACNLEEAGAGVEVPGQVPGGNLIRPLLKKEGPSTFQRCYDAMGRQPG